MGGNIGAAGSGIGRGIASLGPAIAQPINQYHAEHVSDLRKEGALNELRNYAVNPSGQLVQYNPDSPDRDKNLIPFINTKALDMHAANARDQREYSRGARDVATQIQMRHILGAMASSIEDKSLSGQRTAQIISQENQMFPLDVEAKKASTAHMKKITDEEGKIQVPGFGAMTPSQFSAHNIRMERLDILKKKSEPILNFENGLQSAYGLGIQDIVNASQPREFIVKGVKYTGTPYYDAAGNIVSKETAGKIPEKTFVQAGPNNAMIPLTHSSGYGWQQIVPKAKSFAGKLEGLQNDQGKLQQQNQQLQAQQVMSYFQQKGDPTTDEEKAALAKAKAILGF